MRAEGGVPPPPNAGDFARETRAQYGLAKTGGRRRLQARARPNRPARFRAIAVTPPAPHPGPRRPARSSVIRPRMTSATPDTASRRAPLRLPAPSVRQVRLACGLVLFTYVTLHFLNHALGNISVAAMEEGLRVQKLIWQSVPGALALYAALLTHMGLGFWALYERRQFRWTGFEATQLILGPDDPVPARRPRIRDAGRPQPVRRRKGLRPGALQVLVAGDRPSPGAGADDRLGARLHRDPLLARAEARLPAGEEPAAVGRGARADAGAARLRPGRAADPAPRRRSGVAGRDPVAGACRDGGGQRPACCGPQRYGRFSWPGRWPASCSSRGAPPLARALGRVDPADLSRPDDPGEAGPERAGGEPPERRPSRSCLRRTRALLDLPHPRARRPRRPSAAGRGRAGGARAYPRRGGRAARLPVAARRATSPSCRCCRRM